MTPSINSSHQDGSNRVGFGTNEDSEGGDCRALSANVFVGRPSMESDPVWMALL